MKLLITGGCGFIGTNFIYYWLHEHPKDTIIISGLNSNTDCPNTLLIGEAINITINHK